MAWQLASAVWHFYVLGFFLGIAGASFAVALPLLFMSSSAASLAHAAWLRFIAFSAAE